jgi:hypothetical protein
MTAARSEAFIEMDGVLGSESTTPGLTRRGSGRDLRALVSSCNAHGRKAAPFFKRYRGDGQRPPETFRQSRLTNWRRVRGLKLGLIAVELVEWARDEPPRRA